MKASKATERMHAVLYFVIFPYLVFCHFRYNNQKSLPNSVLFYIFILQGILYSTRYVITSCKERFITLASTKLILHDGIVDKALSLELIRKLIIKELVESSECILFCKIQ